QGNDKGLDEVRIGTMKSPQPIFQSILSCCLLAREWPGFVVDRCGGVGRHTVGIGGRCSYPAPHFG
ncbi:MAG: hypothetical protein ACKOJF_11960, partial [Planctomycetaceae bacterium]